MTISIRLILTIIIIVIFFNNDTLATFEKKRIAVLEIDAKNAPKIYADIARDYLEINLHKSDAFVVLERGMINLILKEQGLQMSGCTDTSCVVQIGKLLSADLVVVGSLSKIKTFSFSVKLVDVSKGNIILAETEKAATEENIEAAVKHIADQLSENIKGQTGQKEVTKETTKKPEVKVKEPPVKSEQLFSKKTYGYLSLSFIAISSGLGGTGYYYDMKLKKSKSDYNSLADRYNATSDPTEAELLRSSMRQKATNAEKYENTRNILYGAGIGTTIIALIFIYNYFTAEPAKLTNLESPFIPIMPIIYTSFLTGSYQNKNENFYGAGLLIRF